MSKSKLSKPKRHLRKMRSRRRVRNAVVLAAMEEVVVEEEIAEVVAFKKMKMKEDAETSRRANQDTSSMAEALMMRKMQLPSRSSNPRRLLL